MIHDLEAPVIRSFEVGDGPGIAKCWTAAAPADPIGYQRFRDLVLLDRNFDPAGLKVAVDNDQLVGAAYAVRRSTAVTGTDLEPTTGWIPFFFVHPEHRGRGLGRTLLTAAMDWLRAHGRTEVNFASYTPNYFLPGLDVARYPAARVLTERLGFRTRYEAVAMDRGLVGYELPEEIQKRIATLDGYSFGTPSGDELTSLLAIAADFNPDWARAIREAVVGGLPLDRIVVARAPAGPESPQRLIGWAMHGTYEGVVERFGPFGVLPEYRGTGLGKILLHLTLQRMSAVGAHSAWFLWTGENSPAGQLYLRSGFTITRKFAILRASLDPWTDLRSAP